MKRTPPLQFHRTETNSLVATSQSTWLTGHVYIINRHEDATNKNQPYWTICVQSIRKDKHLHQDYVQTFDQLQKAKAFCQWLYQGHSNGYFSADGRIPMFKTEPEGKDEV